MMIDHKCFIFLQHLSQDAVLLFVLFTFPNRWVSIALLKIILLQHIHSILLIESRGLFQKPGLKTLST